MTPRPASDEKTFRAQKLAMADLIRRDKGNKLSGSTKMVGTEICSLTNFKTGYAWASEVAIAQALGLGHRTIKLAIAALKAAGYILVEKVGRNNRYRPNFDLLKQGQSLPLFDAEKGQGLPLSDAERGKDRREQGQKTTENRGKKVPPISLENSLAISSGAEAAAVGAAPSGAAGLSFDLGLPGAALRQRLGDEVFRSWLGKVAFVGVAAGELVLSAPDPFVASRIARDFEAQILASWRLQHPDIVRLRMTVRQSSAASISARDPNFLWLAQTGIGVVASCAGITRERAHDRLEGWLKRCAQDAAGVRRIVESAAAFDISGPRFINTVNEGVAALHGAEQAVLRFGPEGAVRRNAS